MSDWLDAEGHADRALEMYERGRWAEAESELRKALSLNPDQAEWHFNLGLTLEAAGRDVDALSSYERAIELLPDQPEPLVAAGVVANRLEQFDKAIAWFDEAIRMQPSLEAAYAHKIESHVRLNNHDEAETTFYLAQHALTETSAQCLAVMAESLIRREMHERAEWCLKEALRLEPHMPRLRARLAAVSAATGKPQRALQLYLRELRDDPGNIDTLLEYGQLLVDLGRLPEAGEKFRRVLEIEPANVEAHFELGGIAMASSRYEQANLEFELVMKLDSQFPSVRRAMGEALLRRGRAADARQHLLDEYEMMKSAASEQTSKPSLPQGEQRAAATTSVRGFIAGVEASPSAVANDLAALAGLLLEAEEPARAAELLELALNAKETADILRQLALARFRSGDRSGGATASRRVLRLDPNCLRSIHNLSLAALQEGQARQAAGWIARGLRINRHDDNLRRLRVRVWMAQVKQAWRTMLGFRIGASRACGKS